MLPWKRLLRPLTALLLTAVVAVVPAATAHAAAPSSGWNDYSCKPSATHPAPSSSSTAPSPTRPTTGWPSRPTWWTAGTASSPRLRATARRPLFNALGPIDKSAEQLQVFVDKVLAATGAAKADLVGHSQGGLMPRYYLKFLGGAAKVNTFVGIAPDNHGTTSTA